MRTNAGNDWQASAMGSASGTPANFIGLTENTTAPAAADTTLAGELATTGFARASATYAHTTGANSYTLTKTFTMVAADGSSRTLAKLGVFTAASGGTLVFESPIPNPPTLAPADSIAITETVTI